MVRQKDHSLSSCRAGSHREAKPRPAAEFSHSTEGKENQLQVRADLHLLGLLEDGSPCSFHVLGPQVNCKSFLLKIHSVFHKCLLSLHNLLGMGEKQGYIRW